MALADVMGREIVHWSRRSPQPTDAVSPTLSPGVKDTRLYRADRTPDLAAGQITAADEWTLAPEPVILLTQSVEGDSAFFFVMMT